MAALDLGSNTFLLLIAEMKGNQIKNVLLDETEVTRLGQGVHQSQEFHPEALARADACLRQFSQKIQAHRCDRIVAVATSAARDVKNGERLLELGRKHGIPIQIISGDQEAEITFLGATVDLEAESKSLVVDVGGGSTEIIGLSQNKPQGVSVDVGSVRLTEMFLPQHPCPPSQIKKLEDYVQLQLDLKKDFLPREFNQIVAVAGTPTSLAMLELQTPHFVDSQIHLFELTLHQLWGWRDRLAQLSVADRQKLPGMQPQRADVLVAGVTILACVVRSLGGHGVKVSTRGVRYGVAKSWAQLV